MTIRVSDMALTYVPGHVRRRKRRYDAELQRVLVKRVDFSRRFQPPAHPCASGLIVPRRLRHWTTTRALAILAEKNFGLSRTDGAEGGWITEVPKLLPTQLFEPRKTLRQV